MFYENCPETYNGETGRRLIGRVNKRSEKVINSQMLKNLIEANIQQ